MPHHHNTSCGHEDHEHNHEAATGSGPQDNLFHCIDRSNVVALNASGNGPEIIKPWHERLDEEVFLESDADDQMIIRLPFTGTVQLRSILLKTGPTTETPSKMIVFKNVDNLDFEDAVDLTPTQECEIAQGREVGEYSVRTAKFSNITSITLFFPSSQGADTIKIYYLGFLGNWNEYKSTPVVTVYETQANLADHEKIQGLDGAMAGPQI